MLLDCLLIATAASVSPTAFVGGPFARPPAVARPRACVVLKGFNSKQQELARMMELAEKQRQQPEGTVDLPAPTKKKGKAPPARKAPQTREQLFKAMRKFKEANPDSLKVRPDAAPSPTTHTHTNHRLPVGPLSPQRSLR